MHGIQEKLVFLLILVLPNAKKNQLDTDTCDVQVGCLLLWKQTISTAKLLRYRQQSLINSQHVHGATQQKSPAIFLSVLTIRQYL